MRHNDSSHHCRLPPFGRFLNPLIVNAGSIRLLNSVIVNVAFLASLSVWTPSSASVAVASACAVIIISMICDCESLVLLASACVLIIICECVPVLLVVLASACVLIIICDCVLLVVNGQRRFAKSTQECCSLGPSVCQHCFPGNFAFAPPKCRSIFRGHVGMALAQRYFVSFYDDGVSLVLE